MIQWIQGKAVVLLLLALLVTLGFGLLSYQAYSSTRATLATTLDQLAKTEASYHEYQAMVVNNNQRLDNLLDQLKGIRRQVNDTNKQIAEYPATPILDQPWPDDFIRLYRSNSKLSAPSSNPTVHK